MTNIDWLDNLIAKHPVLLKNFISEVEKLGYTNSSGVLDSAEVIELLQKQVAELKKDATSFRRKEVVAKAYKEATPKRGDGYQAIPLWKFELDGILDHLTSKSIRLEKVSSSIAIHMLDSKVIKLIEKKVNRHVTNINSRLEISLANNSLVAPPKHEKKFKATTAVASRQEVVSIAEYFSIISNGVKKPLYAIFSVSLLCMLFWGGSIFTAASRFFAHHQSYLYICIVTIGISVFKALERSKSSKIEKVEKEKSKSLTELKKKILSKITDHITQQVPSEAQILSYNRKIAEQLAKKVRDGLTEYRVSA